MKPGVRGLADARTSWVAIGFFPQRDTGCGDSCRPEKASLYTSQDGGSWVERPGSMPPAGASILGDDGAGDVLGAGMPKKGVVTLWRLEPGS